MNGHVIELKRIDTALTKTELIDHIEREHSHAPLQGNPERMSKDTLLGLHRLIHIGIDR